MSSWKSEKVNSGWTITPPSGYNMPIPDYESTILEKSDEGCIVSYINDTKINEWLVSSIYIKYDWMD
jgi:hypothetical protein